MTTPQTLIRKIEDRIILNSIFPRLASETAFLREILDDLKKASGHDPVTNVERILGEMTLPERMGKAFHGEGVKNV